MTASRPISARLLEWYDHNARALPWRVPPGAEDIGSAAVCLSLVNVAVVWLLVLLG